MQKTFERLVGQRNFQDAMGVVRGINMIQRTMMKRYPFILDDLSRFSKTVEKTPKQFDFDLSIFQGQTKPREEPNSVNNEHSVQGETPQQGAPVMVSVTFIVFLEKRSNFSEYSIKF